MTKKKRFEYALLSAIILSILISLANTEATCQNISHDVLRLHILANSDSELDQNLKLKVRDAVLSDSENLFNCCNSKDEAISLTKKNKERFLKVAQKTVYDEGYDYPVKLSVTKCFFNTRKYDGFTLPPGYYDALRLEIGSGKGHNWWCVIFPKVCIGAASNIDNNLSDDGAEMVNNPEDYTVKFKIFEVIGDIKEKIFSYF